MVDRIGNCQQIARLEKRKLLHNECHQLFIDLNKKEISADTHE